MISKDELKTIAFQENLDLSQVEKDYVLSWIIKIFFEEKDIQSLFIFKGGTCLRKCYFEGYRYSEDCDFTLRKGMSFSLGMMKEIVGRVALRLFKDVGIEIDLERLLFEVFQNASNQRIIQGRIFYKGPIGPSSPRQWPRIKFDITSDELLVQKPILRPLLHSYSDRSLFEDCRVVAYAMEEIFGEKLRALFERTRPRDLYDVVEIFNSGQLKKTKKDIEKLQMIVFKKFSFKGMQNAIFEQSSLNLCKSGWEEQLSHQLTNLKSFEHYFENLKKVCDFIDLEKTLQEKE